ncbi:unnamed protein product [Caenorhabditis auriculariae]|uniref:Dual specificity protein phosphatase 19 n=1 Tax=Caenorhabditis auriculariae TaxID=2777116 RepID=A0A8S1GYV9_9PELO|nr:unnamed protein product [Caenorhabditis auriculariae]
MPTIEELDKIKNRLKATSTTVTLETGETKVELRQADGTFAQAEEPKQISKRRQKKVEYLRRCGYVVDLKPDLEVGIVREGLLLGSQDVAADLALLQANKVTHIVNCGTGIRNFFPTKLKYLKVEILDLPTEKISQHFEVVHSFIDDSLKEGGKVFVHCNAGVSRSVTLVLSYLMRTEKLAFQEALRVVKEVRPSAKPNAGFCKELEAYEASIV